jgi:hypothetical protein
MRVHGVRLDVNPLNWSYGADDATSVTWIHGDEFAVVGFGSGTREMVPLEDLPTPVIKMLLDETTSGLG